MFQRWNGFFICYEVGEMDAFLGMGHRDWAIGKPTVGLETWQTSTLRVDWRFVANVREFTRKLANFGPQLLTRLDRRGRIESQPYPRDSGGSRHLDGDPSPEVHVYDYKYNTGLNATQVEAFITHNCLTAQDL